MKKIITIILIAIIVIPLFPGKNVQASTTKDQSTPGKINNVKQKAVFYAVGEKNGIKFTGANGGANNFFDALRQSNYEFYKDDNSKLTKGGEKPTERLEKISKEFTQTPKKVRPGVGKITLTGVAFGFVSEMILNSFETWAYGLSVGYQVKVFEKYLDENTTGSAMSEIPGVLFIRKYPMQYDGLPRTDLSVVQILDMGGGKTQEYTRSLSGYYKTGTEKTAIHVSSEQQNANGVWTTTFLVSAQGMHYKQVSKLETGSTTVTIAKDAWTKAKEGGIVADREPKSLGTLNPPDWSNQTDLPDYVELEVPITEDGEIDLDKQLSPENPAKNDPKKPLAPNVTDLPDYTVPDEDSGKKPVPTPNLTPKPNPNTNPLPSPSPLPEPTTPDPTVPPAEDSPTTKPGDTQNRWAALVTNKFPFSLPWDIGNMIEPLLAEPVRPSVKVDVAFDVFGKSVPIKFSHNFAWMDDFIGFVRIFILIGFNLFMITGTRKLMGGGQ